MRARSAILAISSLVKLECLAGPIRSGDTAVRLRYEKVAFARLALLQMPEAVYLGLTRRQADAPASSPGGR